MKKQTIDTRPAGPKPWYDPRVRSLFFQAIAIALVFWGGWILVDNTLSNMESRGISTGFGFLGETAGFGIIMNLVPYDATMSYGRTFWVGLTNTLLVSAMGVVAATILGYGGVGAARAVEHLRAIAVEVHMVNVPSAVHIAGGEFVRVHPLGGVEDDISAIEDKLNTNAMIDDLYWWTDALKTARAATRAEAA